MGHDNRAFDALEAGETFIGRGTGHVLTSTEAYEQLSELVDEFKQPDSAARSSVVMDEVNVQQAQATAEKLRDAGGVMAALLKRSDLSVEDVDERLQSLGEQHMSSTTLESPHRKLDALNTLMVRLSLHLDNGTESQGVAAVGAMAAIGESLANHPESRGLVNTGQALRLRIDTMINKVFEGASAPGLSGALDKVASGVSEHSSVMLQKPLLSPHEMKDPAARRLSFEAENPTLEELQRKFVKTPAFESNDH